MTCCRETSIYHFGEEFVTSHKKGGTENNRLRLSQNYLSPKTDLDIFLPRSPES